MPTKTNPWLSFVYIDSFETILSARLSLDALFHHCDVAWPKGAVEVLEFLVCQGAPLRIALREALSGLCWECYTTRASHKEANARLTCLLRAIQEAGRSNDLRDVIGFGEVFRIFKDGSSDVIHWMHKCGVRFSAHYSRIKGKLEDLFSQDPSDLDDYYDREDWSRAREQLHDLDRWRELELSHCYHGCKFIKRSCARSLPSSSTNLICNFLFGDRCSFCTCTSFQEGDVNQFDLRLSMDTMTNREQYAVQRRNMIFRKACLSLQEQVEMLTKERDVLTAKVEHFEVQLTQSSSLCRDLEQERDGLQVAYHTLDDRLQTLQCELSTLTRARSHGCGCFAFARWASSILEHARTGAV